MLSFLSLSIDLAGSTLAKQSIISAAGPDGAGRMELYREYLNLLFSIEREFYQRLHENLSAASLGMERVFLVKSIGDELWYAIEVDEERPGVLADVAMAVIDACSDCISAERYLSLTGAAAGEMNGEFENTNFPIKVVLDYVRDPIEITQLRYEYMKDVITGSLGEGSVILPSDAKLARMYDLLNLTHGNGYGHGAARGAARKDFIGFEIDRFFRAAKMARPSILAVGEALFTKLPAELHIARPGTFQMGLQKAVFGGTTARERMVRWCIHERLTPETLKGVSEGYSLYHLFQSQDFDEPSMGMTQASLSLLAPSFAFLAEHGFFLLEAAER